MLDSLTLDQLVMFMAVVDEGSFSAAARKLRRVQSAVSHAMANLEKQLGLPLWDRGSRVPTLTPQGHLLLTRARRVVAEAESLRNVARELAGGVEPRISLAVDVFFPLKALVASVRDFRAAYPGVELCVQTETLSAASALVKDGTCDAGIVSEDANLHGLHFSHSANVRLVTVVAPEHPLARASSGSKRGLTMEDLAAHVQIVLSERSSPRASTGKDHAVLSPETWRVADLETKRELLVGGVGWGNMPEHSVREDLKRKRLVRIRPATWSRQGISIALLVVRRPNVTFGPAMSWLIDRLTKQCTSEVKAESPRSASS